MSLMESSVKYSLSRAYLVEKGYWLLHARHCRTQAGSSVIHLTDTTLSEDPELWNQLRVLQLPSKMIIILWRIILNAHPARAELRRQIRTEKLYALLCPRYTIGHFFPQHLERYGLVQSFH